MLNLKFKKINGENWHMNLLDSRGRLDGEIVPKPPRPVGEAPRGWHRRTEYVDGDNNLWAKGVFMGKAS